MSSNQILMNAHNAHHALHAKCNTHRLLQLVTVAHAFVSVTANHHGIAFEYIHHTQMRSVRSVRSSERTVLVKQNRGGSEVAVGFTRSIRG